MDPISPDSQYIIYPPDGTKQRANTLEAGAVREDRSKYRLFVDDERLEVFANPGNETFEVILTPNEYDLLRLLFERIGSSWTIEELHERIWGEAVFETLPIERLRKLVQNINKKTGGALKKSLRKQRDRISVKIGMDACMIVREE